MRWINFITASNISTDYFLTLQRLPSSFALLVVWATFTIIKTTLSLILVPKRRRPRARSAEHHRPRRRDRPRRSWNVRTSLRWMFRLSRPLPRLRQWKCSSFSHFTRYHSPPLPVSINLLPRRRAPMSCVHSYSRKCPPSDQWERHYVKTRRFWRQVRDAPFAAYSKQKSSIIEGVQRSRYLPLLHLTIFNLLRFFDFSFTYHSSVKASLFSLSLYI